ncbi:choice-of-anchor Q domain-containing protein [Arthrobacter sp. GMC3]|uniref:choice-of-anchor Q domain-containing protein n=1 Tax=Arthrobacter sp. GMC3 TaxID=2058894 RepID=UPI000CE2EC00|nr:choice-of-anchor Q domain-containing protein [Arthrobacter sp. GMC3]
MLTVGASLFVAVLPASAATLTVTSTVDGDVGSLRSVLSQAAPGDVIEIPSGWELPIAQGQLQITTQLTLRGAGGARPTMYSTSATNPLALIQVQAAASLTFEGINLGGAQQQDIGIRGNFNAGALTIRDANFSGFSRSIVPEDTGASILIERVRVTGGDIGLGAGAIQPGAQVVVRDSVFDGQGNFGIRVGGTDGSDGSNVVVERTRFVNIGNGEPGDASISVGAVFATRPGDAPALDLRESVISDSNFSPVGGAIRFGNVSNASQPRGPSVRMLGTTIIRATASPILYSDVNTPGPGGTAVNDRLVIENSTIQGFPDIRLFSLFQQHGGKTSDTVVGIDHSTIQGTLNTPDNAYLTAHITNTVIDSGTTPLFDVVKTTHTAQDSVFTVVAPEFPAGNRVILAADLGLQPLAPAINGLPVRLLSATSPLLDTAAASSALVNDQRGLPRVSGIASDVGAVEMQRWVLTISGGGVVQGGSAAYFTVHVVTRGELPGVAVVETADGTALAGTDYTWSSQSFILDPAAVLTDFPVSVTTLSAASDLSTFIARLSTGVGNIVQIPVAGAQIRNMSSSTPTPTGVPTTASGSPSAPVNGAGSSPTTGELAKTGVSDGPVGVTLILAAILLVAGGGILLRRRGA